MATGLIDLDLITTGQSMVSRRRIGDLTKAVSDHLARRKARTVPFAALLHEMNESADQVCFFTLYIYIFIIGASALYAYE